MRRIYHTTGNQVIFYCKTGTGKIFWRGRGPWRLLVVLQKDCYYESPHYYFESPHYYFGPWAVVTDGIVDVKEFNWR
jgi:hypothetical protein